MAVFQFIVLVAFLVTVFGQSNAALRGNKEELLAVKKAAPKSKAAPKRNQPTSTPTVAAVITCPQLPALNQMPDYGYVSIGSTGRYYLLHLLHFIFCTL